MKYRQTGFTMIELIVVIVILGILSAVALPKFIDLSSDAKASALKGVAGAAASGMTINYSGCSLTSHAVTPGKCIKIDGCAAVASAMQGGLPAGYAVADKSGVTNPTASPANNGKELSCTMTQTDGGGTQDFVGILAAN